MFGKSIKKRTLPQYQTHLRRVDNTLAQNYFIETPFFSTKIINKMKEKIPPS